MLFKSNSRLSLLSVAKIPDKTINQKLVLLKRLMDAEASLKSSTTSTTQTEKD